MNVSHAGKDLKKSQMIKNVTDEYIQEMLKKSKAMLGNQMTDHGNLIIALMYRIFNELYHFRKGQPLAEMIPDGWIEGELKTYNGKNEDENSKKIRSVLLELRRFRKKDKNENN